MLSMGGIVQRLFCRRRWVATKQLFKSFHCLPLTKSGQISQERKAKQKLTTTYRAAYTYDFAVGS